MADEKRLIDAYRLENLVRSNSARYHHVDDVIAAIAGQPTVDAVEVVHGKWSPVDVIAKRAGYSVRYYHHAECKVNPCRLIECIDDYCPLCGAKMDGGNEDA